MRWYKNVFLGVNAGNNIRQVIKKIRKKKDLHDIYIVTPAENDSDLLDIYDAVHFFRRGFKQPKKKIVGVAIGKEEAYDLTGAIINQVYRQTGGFDVKKYLLNNKL